MRWYIDANATERIEKIKDFDIQVIVHCDDEGKAEIWAKMREQKITRSLKMGKIELS